MVGISEIKYIKRGSSFCSCSTQTYKFAKHKGQTGIKNLYDIDRNPFLFFSLFCKIHGL